MAFTAAVSAGVVVSKRVREPAAAVIVRVAGLVLSRLLRARSIALPDVEGPSFCILMGRLAGFEEHLSHRLMYDDP